MLMFKSYILSTNLQGFTNQPVKPFCFSRRDAGSLRFTISPRGSQDQRGGIAFADLHAPRLLLSPMGARPERESFIYSSPDSMLMGCRSGKASERLCVSLVGARASDHQARCERASMCFPAHDRRPAFGRH